MSQKFQNIMKLVIPFTGHKEVLSLHEKTLEITKDDSLTSVSYTHLRAHET